MGKIFSISKLPIFDISDINERMEYFNLLEKELDKYSPDTVDMIEYEEMEKHLCWYRQVIKDKIKATSKDDTDASTLEELKIIVDNLIKKTGKKKQQRMKITFANRLDKLYKSKRLNSKEELENYLGVSQQTISSYFNGYNPTMPSLDKLLRLCDFFDCSLDYLINEKVEETAIGYDTVTKETGLTSKSINTLGQLATKNSKVSRGIIETINFLISKLSIKNDYEGDILSALSEYFGDDLSYGNNFYYISGETFSNFKEQFNEAQSVSEAINTFATMQSTMEDEERYKEYSYAGPETLNLLNIQNKLIKAKVELKKEREEELDIITKED